MYGRHGVFVYMPRKLNEIRRKMVECSAPSLHAQGPPRPSPGFQGSSVRLDHKAVMTTDSGSPPEPTGRQGAWDPDTRGVPNSGRTSRGGPANGPSVLRP